MSAQQQPAAVPNDGCTAAPVVTIVSGRSFVDTINNTTDATSDNVFCGDITETDIGVWYSYESENDTVVEAVITGSTFAARLSVFDGSCDNLNCLDVTTSWVAYAGVEYHLLVSGVAASTGSFTIEISVRSTRAFNDMLPDVRGVSKCAILYFFPFYLTMHGFTVYSRNFQGHPTMNVQPLEK